MLNIDIQHYYHRSAHKLTHPGSWALLLHKLIKNHTRKSRPNSETGGQERAQARLIRHNPA